MEDMHWWGWLLWMLTSRHKRLLACHTASTVFQVATPSSSISMGEMVGVCNSSALVKIHPCVHLL